MHLCQLVLEVVPKLAVVLTLCGLIIAVGASRAAIGVGDWCKRWLRRDGQQSSARSCRFRKPFHVVYESMSNCAAVVGFLVLDHPLRTKAEKAVSHVQQTNVVLRPWIDDS